MKPLLKAALLLISIAGLYYCSPKVAPQTSEVSFLYKGEDGTMGVRGIGYGNNRNAAIMEAQISAFRVLLFRGIPGTELNVPMIENESEARAKNPGYFSRLFEQQWYKTFMMSSTESSGLSYVNGMYKISVDVKINYAALRRDLEQNSVTRKFGY